MIRLTIPGEPMGKQRPKFGNGRTYTPQKTVNYETLVKELYIMQNCGKQLEGQIEILVTAVFGPAQSAPKKRLSAMLCRKERPTKKPDCDNILKIICDALNGLAYRDDAQIVSARIDKFYGCEPRVEVEIQEIGA